MKRSRGRRSRRRARPRSTAAAGSTSELAGSDTVPDRLVEAVLRDADDDDAAAVLALNNSCVPAVGAVDLEKMRWFLDTCPYFRLVAVDERRAPREATGDGTTAAQPQRAPDDGRTHALAPIV